MPIQLAENLFKKSDFSECQKLLLAVSGGGDSLALLFLVRDHLKTLSAPPEVIVVTVDHQLRQESAREAEYVAEICHAYQMKHIIVRWEGEKPKTNISEKARIARYDLLFKEAQKQGATLIMTGHTLNDQVETYQMRSQRVQKKQKIKHKKSTEKVEEKLTLQPDTGVENDQLEWRRGLSCMPRESLLCQKVRLIRPLLGVRRATLRSYLSLKGKTWIEDPTNEDMNFERVRVRHSIPSEQLMTIAGKINEATLKRRQQAQKIADLILALDISVKYGRCFIKNPAPCLYKHPYFSFVVGLFAVLMGGRSYLLSYQKLMNLGQKLCLQYPEKQRLTLGGSVIEYSQKGISFWREFRNLKEETIAPGETLVWDGRYQVTNHEKQAIKVGAADLEHLKYFLDNGIVSLERPHFPSLQTLLMISKETKIIIPELTDLSSAHHEIAITRIMAPFNWLLSQEDAAIVHVIWPFFRI
ncbi:tRNA lysidine(34) synthetase TilS [Bartonella sp. F02]|uniref:tRNA lysidine(34) synthetase TilS n=1 Tax=Bartonella sp. F02 TaxID=2967262 RepID=UPI0022A95CA2|nr:tRNA lysidine(34) synthetase TilS [Bartonella sp. F02]MCZ2328838.1 tRNA lysidine(34) synthetase TilS [Bartonella sp. F02]